LKLLLDIVYYVLWALLGLASVIIVVIIFAGLYRFTGVGPDLPTSVTAFLSMDVVVALPMAIVALAAIVFIIDRLRRIFRTLNEGDPFVPENAGHLRAIALGILVYQVLSYASHGVIALVFTLSGNPVESGGRVVPEFSLNLGAWFAIIAFLVLAEVFVEGARLRDEQKFTI
jgi:hypothetical protein